MEFTYYYYFFFSGGLKYNRRLLLYKSQIFSKLLILATVQSIVGTPPFSAEGVEPPSEFSKRAGLDKTSTFREVAWKEGGDFFQGGYNFHIKNKLKSEIFLDNRSL